MNQYLKVSGLDPKVCASLLGVSPVLFAEWTAGQQAVPASVASHIAAVLGVPLAELVAPSGRASDPASVEPAIWFKLRGEALRDADLEVVVMIRRLGVYVDELEELLETPSKRWRLYFEEIRKATDFQAAPREQGKQAAVIFRDLCGLEQGKWGVGSRIRNKLRRDGVLVVESPLQGSLVEGCAFFVGHAERPCVFASNYKTTWFRRNHLLLHELAHCIFDARSEGASVDRKESGGAQSLIETRADAFAQEVLVPKAVLQHVAQSYGLNWASLSEASVAQLVASTETEQRMVARAALDAGLVDELVAERIKDMDLQLLLPTLTDRALSTEAYLAKLGDAATEWRDKRSTTTSSRNLRLPSSYIQNVVRVFRDGRLSLRRAAELLMISPGTFEERFPDEATA